MQYRKKKNGYRTKNWNVISGKTAKVKPTTTIIWNNAGIWWKETQKNPLIFLNLDGATPHKGKKPKRDQPEMEGCIQENHISGKHNKGLGAEKC